MALTIRPATADDAAECGRIIHAAFKSIATHHNFAADFPSDEVAVNLASMLIGHGGFYGVVAERERRILGSNFLDERSSISGIGPITVDPVVQNEGIGRRLMEAVTERAVSLKASGLRLVQDAYHNRSLCLYTKLGFSLREPISLMQGEPLNLRFPGYTVRPATAEDLAACNRLCQLVHGFDRSAELADAVERRTAVVVEHRGCVTGYATEIGFFAHAVGENNDSIKAMIAAAPAFTGPGFFVPTRNHELFHWCLDHRLRLVRQGTLMTRGLYNEPSGTWLPSILY